MVRDGLARRLRQRVPAVAEVERTADPGCCSDAFLVRRGPRRVVAAERNTGDADRAEAVDLVEHGADRTFVIRVDVRVQSGLALSGPVEGEGRKTAVEEDLLPVEELLLRRVEPREQEHERRLCNVARLPQVAGHREAVEWDLDPLGARIEQAVRLADRRDRLVLRVLVARHVEHPDELGEVVRECGAHPRLARGERASRLLGLAGELRVHVAVRDPRRQPLLPALDRTGDGAEVVHVDALRGEARRPVRDRRLDALVTHGLQLLHRPSPPAGRGRGLRA